MMAQTRGPTCRLAVVAAVMLVGVGMLGLTSQARAVAYTFTPIAEFAPGTGFSSAGSINKDGTVAYVVSTSQGEQVLKTDVNGVTTKIADTSGLFTSFLHSSTVESTPVIDDSGNVVFAAWRGGWSATGIYTGSGGVLRTVAEAPGGGAAVYRPYINGAGQIQYAASLQAGGTQVLVDDHGAAKLIADSTGPFTTVGGMGIDSSGRVAIGTLLADSGQQAYFIKDGDSLVEFARNGLFFEQVRDFSISAYQAVFTATLVGGGQGIYSYRNGQITKLFDGTNGFIGFSSFGINDTGGLVFLAGTGTAAGVYSGEDPTTPVIPYGAPLLGSTIQRIEMFPNLNDAGQFAFYASLADNRKVLVRGDPVPEPACMSLILIGLWIVGQRKPRF